MSLRLIMTAILLFALRETCRSSDFSIGCISMSAEAGRDIAKRLYAINKHTTFTSFTFASSGFEVSYAYHDSEPEPFESVLVADPGRGMICAADCNTFFRRFIDPDVADLEAWLNLVLPNRFFICDSEVNVDFGVLFSNPEQAQKILRSISDLHSGFRNAGYEDGAYQDERYSIDKVEIILQGDNESDYLQIMNGFTGCYFVACEVELFIKHCGEFLDSRMVEQKEEMK